MKIKQILLMAFASLCLVNPVFNSVEAKEVVLLPLINRTTEYEDFGQIYYNRAINVMKLNDEYSLTDDRKIEELSTKFTKEGILPSEMTCREIAEAANADIVIAMEMNKLDVIELPSTKMNDDVLLLLKGKFVSYNRETGKYQMRNLADENKMRGAFLNRYNLEASLFSDTVTREMKKALGIKKLSLEGPKVGNLKGDRRN